jgi:SagB-type dehydrogenase family enzyme
MGLSSAEYHHQTSYQRHKMSGHALDWQNRPDVFKTYPNVEPLPLPRDVPLPAEKLSTLLRDRPAQGAEDLDLGDLARIFLLTYSLTAKARYASGEFHYRSVPSAGALYPTEIYVAARGLKGLNDGLYHFSIAHHGLSLLRRGDVSPLVRGVAPWKGHKPPRLTFFFSAIFFRSAWKYRERAYRYHLLDTGHLIENLVLALKASKLPCEVSYDFDDSKTNRLLGLDETKEATLAVLHVPGDGEAPCEPIEISPLAETFSLASRVAPREIDYPEIVEAHRSGRLVKSSSPESVFSHGVGGEPDRWTPVPLPRTWPEEMNYADAVFRRRSRRNYVRKTLPRDCMGALLHSLADAFTDESFSHPGCGLPIAIGLLVGQTESMEPGYYLFDPFSFAIRRVSPGLYNGEMAQVCLDQAWLSYAAAHFLFMADLDRAHERWGARGYRYAMMTAGRLGERIYIAATAMGLGCCGIGAFYDSEAVELLDLPSPTRLLYLVAVGAVKSLKND